MAPYGELKCNSLVYETGSGDVTLNVSTIPPGNSPVFTGDVTLTGASYNVVFNASNNALEFADNAKAVFGTTLTFYNNGTNSYINEAGTGKLYIQGNDLNIKNAAGTETLAYFSEGAEVGLYHAANIKLVTSATGIDVTGTAVTDGLTVAGASDFTGLLKEAVTVNNGKLSDNDNLDIENGNVFMFLTAESTTSTPNLRYNASTTLDSKMAVGDCLSVTIITTANASGFSAQLKVDGVDVTEYWTGGSAPSAGGSSGFDIHAYTIIKTGSSSIASDYKVIANHTKTS